MKALSSIPQPTTAGELQQFLCASNWIRESVLEYGRIVQPLQHCLDRALAGGKRTKRATAGIKIELGDVERDSFARLKSAIAHSVELAHPSPTATTCLFTDASDTGWSIIATQVEQWIAGQHVTDQSHRLLVCMSGSFEGSQKNSFCGHKASGYSVTTAT